LVSCSWAAGFVVLGSPGGLGVREFVIANLSAGDEEFTRFAVVATVTRLCSIIGDVFSFLVSLFFDRRLIN